MGFSFGGSGFGGSGFRGSPIDPRVLSFLGKRRKQQTAPFRANLDLLQRTGRGGSVLDPSFRQQNRLADPDVAAIQAKLRAQAPRGPLRLPKELLGLGSSNQSQLNRPIPAGQGVFGTPFRGAINPQDAILKPLQKLRSTGQLFPQLQGLTSTDVLNRQFGGATEPFGQGILDKIGSKIRSQRGLNTGIGLGAQIPAPLHQRSLLSPVPKLKETRNNPFSLFPLTPPRQKVVKPGLGF